MSTARLIDGRLMLTQEASSERLLPPLQPSSDEHLSKIERLQLLERKIELQEGLPHIYGWKFYPWARQYFEARNKETFLCAANQISKAQCVESLVPTPTGYRRFGDLKIGDSVFDQRGQPTVIVDIPYEGEDEAYELEFGDGSTVIASGKHLWFCKGYRERFRKTYEDRLERSKTKGLVFLNENYGKWQVLTTVEMLRDGGYRPETIGAKRFSIPLCQPIQYTDRELFDPYLVGLLLGDGSISSGSVILTNTDWEIIDYVRSSYEVNSFDGYEQHRLIGLVPTIREIGLFGTNSHTKFIPDEYKFSSIEQRQCLIQGLFDTDAHIKENGTIIYSTVSERLSNDVVEVINSLGGVAKISKRKTHYTKNGERTQCSDSYQINVKIQINPFRLSRKADKFRSDIRYKHERVIRSIRPVGKCQMRCITVAAEDGSYLTGKNYVVTHNSSSQIRKMIHWATATDLWPALWPNSIPRQFWYLYPTRDVCHIEVTKKWVPEFLPRGKYKEDPVYGWRAEYSNKRIWAIHFNSGVSIYFKTYAQDVKDLQSGTCWMLACDEETPEELMSELNMRLASSDGYLSAVFTPTVGSEYWRQCIEETGKDRRFPNSWRKQVSMYDCLTYEDGTPSGWTQEKITRAINSCKSPQDVERRVYGKFVVSEGLKYPGFHRLRNRTEGHPLPKNWSLWCGVDPGSGGENHPAAITVVAVSPDFTKGRVFRGWRGDGAQTTAGDVVKRAIQMTKDLEHCQIYYDWGCRDFYLIAQAAGLYVEPAEKSHLIGEQMLNVLFKNQMLMIYDYPELDPLCIELATLRNDTRKNQAKDDFVDSLRYAISLVPWNWNAIKSDFVIEPVVRKPKREREIDIRRRFWEGEKDVEKDLVTADEELSAWNDLMRPDFGT